MNNSERPVQERNYIAFISYRHKPLDARAAKQIQSRIERYIVPREFRGSDQGKKLGMVFRDEDELPVSYSLNDSIVYALDHSRYLIVICTPDLPESKWCEAEIRYFLETHDRDHIIAVLADGSPEKSFPPLLLHKYDDHGNIIEDVEPLAANIAGGNGTIRKKSLKKESIRIIASLLGVPFDALWQREKRSRTNRLMALLGLTAFILTAFLGVVLSKNAQITSRNQALQRQISTILVDSGKAKLEHYDVDGALQNGLDALLGEDGENLYDHRAEALLTEALGAYDYRTDRSSILYDQGMNIESMAATADGQYALLSDRQGMVRCIEIKTGRVHWSAATLMAGKGIDFNENYTSLFVLDEAELVLCKNTTNVSALSLENGTLAWEYAYYSDEGNNFCALSPEGDILLLMDGDDTDGTPRKLHVLDTFSGEEKGSCDMGDPSYEIDLGGDTNWYYGGAAFSEDQSRAVVALYERIVDKNGFSTKELQCMFFLMDTEKWEILHKAWVSGLERGALNILYGMHLKQDVNQLFAALYEDGMIITEIFDWDDMTSKREITNQTLRSSDGMNYNLYGEYHVQPMLADEHIALVFSDNTVFLFDSKDGILIRSYEMQGAVLYAWWMDEEEGIAAFLMDNGYVACYEFGHDTDEYLRSYYVLAFDQTGLRMALPISGGTQRDPEKGSYLTVLSSQPELLRVRSVTDPSASDVEVQEDFLPHFFTAQASPSGNRIMRFFPYYGEDHEQFIRVESLDTASAEVQRSLSFPVISVQYDPVVIDDTHFIFGCGIYDLEEEKVSLLEELSEEKYYSGSLFHSIRLTDGSVLTMQEWQEEDGPLTGRCWLNGKLVEESVLPDSGIVLETGREEQAGFLYSPGANGYVLGYGVLQGAREKDSGTGQKFVAFDTESAQRMEVDDLCPEAVERTAVVGTDQPVFACAYDDGRIALYNMTDGTGRLLDAAYTPGEIQAVCFSEGDDILLVLTMAGKLDCYSLPDGTLMMSEKVNAIQEETNRLRSSYGQYSSMTCRLDKEQNRLHVLIGQKSDHVSIWMCIDKDAWIVTAQAQGVLSWISETDEVYIRVWEDRIRRVKRFHVYTLEELQTWAEEELYGKEDGSSFHLLSWDTE